MTAIKNTFPTIKDFFDWMNHEKKETIENLSKEKKRQFFDGFYGKANGFPSDISDLIVKFIRSDLRKDAPLFMNYLINKSDGVEMTLGYDGKTTSKYFKQSKKSRDNISEFFYSISFSIKDDCIISFDVKKIHDCIEYKPNEVKNVISVAFEKENIKKFRRTEVGYGRGESPSIFSHKGNLFLDCCHLTSPSKGKFTCDA